MKKTLIASAIALTAIASANANASITITSMDFGGNYAAEGTITDSGAFGSFNSVDPFFYQPWTATQETAVITNSNGVTFAGSTALGAYDFSNDIKFMRNDQVAVGTYFNWSGNNGIAVLAVFDCTSGTACVGQTTGHAGVQFGGMQTQPFPGQLPAFNGTGTLAGGPGTNEVPVPAAVWLFGSGLLGLVGVARRKKSEV